MRRALAKLLRAIAWRFLVWAAGLEGYKLSEMVVSTDWREMD